MFIKAPLNSTKTNYKTSTNKYNTISQYTNNTKNKKDEFSALTSVLKQRPEADRHH